MAARNKIAAVSAAAGLQQGLHNEGFEVSSVEGKRTYDLLFELLDPKLVQFQFQMSTIRDGLVAADYFTKYPGRFYSMHLQDWNAETKTVVAVGKGSIDWKKTFAAGWPAPGAAAPPATRRRERGRSVPPAGHAAVPPGRPARRSRRRDLSSSKPPEDRAVGHGRGPGERR